MLWPPFKGARAKGQAMAQGGGTLRERADEGDMSAQFELGVQYEGGEGSRRRLPSMTLFWLPHAYWHGPPKKL